MHRPFLRSDAMVMKKYQFIFLLGLLTLVLLVACRREEGQTSVPEPTATVTPAAVRDEEVSGATSTPGNSVPAASTSAGSDEAAGVLFTVPFEVRPDGFSFRNYGGNYPEGRFTIAELREQFGDGVCSRIDEDGAVCIPTAEAQQWIDDRNADMSVGHCIGFTVASYRFAQGELQPETFGPNAETPFELERKAPIMRTIAANGSLYWAKSVWSSEVSGTPRDIIDALIALKEPVDLSIYLPGLVGGHSLLAYGVEEVAPQQYHILVYDNNFPGQPAFVEVDYDANTWRYANGAVNPDEVAVPYEGDAGTETLRFIPLSVYDAVECPFCQLVADDGEDIEAFTLLSFLGQGDVLVETTLGAIGWVAGELVNEIPGARFIFQRGQLAADNAPDIILPAGLDFTAQFTGMNRVSSLGPEASVILDQLTPTSEQSALAVTSSTQGVQYQAGGEQSPTLKATVRQEDTTYRVGLMDVVLTDGQSVAMSAPEDSGFLAISSPDVEIADGTLLITRLTSEDEAIFATTALAIEEGGGVALDVAAWDGSGSMDVYGDEDGDGEFDEQPSELPNEPVTEVIRQSDSAVLANVVDHLNPYLGEEGLEAILAGLAEQDLSGQKIGEIVRPFHLPNDRLISFITTLELPIPEMAEMLYALRLDDEEDLEIVIEGLDLAEEDESALRDYLANLALYAEIIADWEFLKSDDMTRLAELLNERALTAEQFVQLLPRMGLSTEELEQLLGLLNLSAADLAYIAEQLELDLSIIQGTTTRVVTATVTANATMTITPTATPTPSPTVTPTPTIGSTPPPTGTPDPYPAEPPPPTQTPGSYPYPGPEPSPTGTPGAYPGVTPSAVPAYLSTAFCAGDDLRVVAQEPDWKNVTVTISAGGAMLISGVTGPNGEPFEATLPGPGTWTDLVIEASADPGLVPLGTISCP